MEYEENSSPSSSLPPLMEPYFTFDQTQTELKDLQQQQQQVSCFSNIFATDQQQPPPFSYLANMDLTPNLSTKISLPVLPFNGGLTQPAENHGFGSYINPSTSGTTTASSSSCHEQKVLKAVLNQLTKTEYCGGSPSFGEASTSESLLSEVALSTMWNNQY
ncbi:OLC1v1022311C1 [Oldenlandia corymbosa var. corymbosa]|uniref:OLC1v1022311C1 n=1 Tax=Oldenlandia corymbosa var. corymbosa TaxID=529605 RepID=A0AAV1BXK5_OLDCO|nr:OLC1v1022311C1 [Oldenlandia corymbosa var. corymbosa]